MNGLDLVITALAAAAALGGYRLGFVTRVTSWLGMLAGIAAGGLALPAVVDGLDANVDRPGLVLVAAAVVIGAGLLGQAAGLFVGSKLHHVIPIGPARLADSMAGSVAGVLGVAVAVWLVVPAMADVPDWPARQARGSVVMRQIDRWFPDAPDATQSVRHLLGERYPQVFDALSPAPDVGPPPSASGLSAASADRVQASVVLVAGQACGRVQEGTGFVVGDGLVATNAHVVAGEPTTVVETNDGSRHDARVVAFDPDRDLAIVQVAGLQRPPLTLRPARTDDQGAVFGHPGGGPLRLAPFRVSQLIKASGADIYDNRGVERDVLILAAELRPGDSGAALVSPDGNVIGVAFAIAPDRPGVAYALGIGELLEVMATVGPDPVSAGACLA